jgi:uncharacterized protein YjbI with pentapeptide repeats
MSNGDGSNELDKLGPNAAREAELRGFGVDRAPLSKGRLLEFFDHQRWLNSAGRFGTRMQAAQSVTADRKDFGNHDLSGVDFSLVNFKNVMFVLCNLKKASFAGARLEHVTFLGCDLAEADFRGAQMSYVSFDESNQKQALFDPEATWSLDNARPSFIFFQKGTQSPKI